MRNSREKIRSVARVNDFFQGTVKLTGWIAGGAFAALSCLGFYVKDYAWLTALNPITRIGGQMVNEALPSLPNLADANPLYLTRFVEIVSQHGLVLFGLLVLGTVTCWLINTGTTLLVRGFRRGNIRVRLGAAFYRRYLAEQKRPNWRNAGLEVRYGRPVVREKRDV